MKDIRYWFIKQLIKAALFCYYKKVKIYGFSALQSNQPSMLLPNHQNALMDALLIAAYSKKAPYFLTRSDVFNNGLLRTLFRLLRMLPIYRLRDGRDNLTKNQEIFDRCAHLLKANASILIFPEANHNIRRMVRPLSPGFTRILFNTLNAYPGLDILLYPVGVNYIDAAGFPDSAAFYLGQPQNLNKLYNSEDLRMASMQIRAQISAAIKQLTTHIGEELPYEEIIDQLDGLQPNYLDPKACNKIIEELLLKEFKAPPSKPKNLAYHIWDGIFQLANLPVLLIWRGVIKQKIREIEFVSTYRFLFSLFFYPLYYALLLLLLSVLFSFGIAVAVTVLLFAFNLIYVKLR